MALQIPPEEEFTELAKYYGEDSRFQALKGTKKSGVTPVDPLPPARLALSRENWQIRRLIEATQKAKLIGFTARELKAMGAFAYFESPMASNISSPIHPVFSNWESSDAAMMRRHNPMIPLGKGRDGYWEVSISVGSDLKYTHTRCRLPTLWFRRHLNPVFGSQRSSLTTAICGLGW